MKRRDCLIALAGATGALTAGAGSGARAGGAGQAPEFVGLEGWLNTRSALSIAGLRGKVVLVDFWTYSCINARRSLFSATFG